MKDNNLFLFVLGSGNLSLIKLKVSSLGKKPSSFATAFALNLGTEFPS